ncbi:GNAT family N-acetyltransferase [Flavobacterium sp. W22_SRS_FP1]|uniref:GNAT family N-acetyltransferase n=1 Tax=Flavobacterium sp. W22_SRS_FP1 TaxID=3240276 RepID=UPI003F8EBA28
MIENLTIREYKSNDKNEVLAILKRNVPKYFAESEIEDLKEYLKHKIEKYFVTTIGDVIIGAGGINFDDNSKTAKISWDFVDIKFKGRGIGQSLLKYRIDFIQSNYVSATIKVRTSQLAYKFYEKNGFTLKEIEKDYWAKGFDLYSMTYE